MNATTTYLSRALSQDQQKIKKRGQAGQKRPNPYNIIQVLCWRGLVIRKIQRQPQNSGIFHYITRETFENRAIVTQT
jgi:hypothetical protein